MSDLLFTFFELLGVAASAYFGSSMAVTKRTDMFGVLFIGVTNALGGGIFRDLLCGTVPPRMFRDYTFLALSSFVSITVFVVTAIAGRQRYVRSAETLDRINNIIDAIGIGAFTLTGCRVAFIEGHGDNICFVLFLGLVTSIGGGLARDIILGEIPFVLKKRIYAIASLFGGCVFCLLDYYGFDDTTVSFATIISVFIIRLLATRLRWNLPRADDIRK